MEEQKEPAIVSLEDARKAIESEKKQRAEVFLEEYKELCTKYNCEIQINGFIVIAK